MQPFGSLAPPKREPGHHQGRQPQPITNHQSLPFPTAASPNSASKTTAALSRTSSSDTSRPSSKLSDVIRTPLKPHGVMDKKPVRSDDTFKANPCMVIQRRTPIPIEAILRFSTQTPVLPSQNTAWTPKLSTKRITAISRPRK